MGGSRKLGHIVDGDHDGTVRNEEDAISRKMLSRVGKVREDQELFHGEMRTSGKPLISTLTSRKYLERLSKICHILLRDHFDNRLAV